MSGRLGTLAQRRGRMAPDRIIVSPSPTSSAVARETSNLPSQIRMATPASMASSSIRPFGSVTLITLAAGSLTQPPETPRVGVTEPQPPEEAQIASAGTSRDPEDQPPVGRQPRSSNL